uniref:Uncharacterized protein n=1 Tax=Rhizophagus irregularis (strain DAOM 181602 / DAOM 197198 / MUCL 43194) TaxID=747089 RepID=U9TZ66_RHIID
MAGNLTPSVIKSPADNAASMFSRGPKIQIIVQSKKQLFCHYSLVIIVLSVLQMLTWKT